jgi:hypothetical protein
MNKIHGFEVFASKVDDIMDGFLSNALPLEAVQVELSTVLAMHGWTWDEYETHLAKLVFPELDFPV